ncbi:hypothetical protein GCM10022230_04570 [Pseudoclavibacter caeni]
MQAHRRAVGDALAFPAVDDRQLQPVDIEWGGDAHRGRGAEPGIDLDGLGTPARRDGLRAAGEGDREQRGAEQRGDPARPLTSRVQRPAPGPWVRCAAVSRSPPVEALERGSTTVTAVMI